ncbi:hypothetical protein RJ55_05095 [Drechmeria coniospora]|nr:hypothetical protein RJ55_05095 [Drechmeria coniospora]
MATDDACCRWLSRPRWPSRVLSLLTTAFGLARTDSTDRPPTPEPHCLAIPSTGALRWPPCYPHLLLTLHVQLLLAACRCPTAYTLAMIQVDGPTGAISGSHIPEAHHGYGYDALLVHGNPSAFVCPTPCAVVQYVRATTDLGRINSCRVLNPRSRNHGLVYLTLSTAVRIPHTFC